MASLLLFICFSVDWQYKNILSGIIEVNETFFYESCKLSVISNIGKAEITGENEINELKNHSLNRQRLTVSCEP